MLYDLTEGNFVEECFAILQLLCPRLFDNGKEESFEAMFGRFNECLIDQLLGPYLIGTNLHDIFRSIVNVWVVGQEVSL